ncbi:MAG: carbohydrate kinase [Deltaproteobacteria bacterium]|nr:carbohydrate kinase [Deltaproteobacteria bacterium]
MFFSFVGHLSVDVNVVRGQPHTLHGGGVVHGAITARRLGAEAGVLTKCAAEDRGQFTVLAEAGVPVSFLPSERTTSIRNDYPSADPDDRRSTLISAAAPFGAADLDGLPGGLVHVNPLWAGEFPPGLLVEARRKAAFLGADAQGFLRRMEPERTASYQDWTDKGQYLGLLDLLKVDAREAEVLTGQEDRQAAARLLLAQGVRCVLLTHEQGVLACTATGSAEAPFGPYTIEGRTGRGDTCTAAFLVARLLRGLDLAAATRFAAEVTTRKMQQRGPYQGEA